MIIPYKNSPPILSLFVRLHLKIKRNSQIIDPPPRENQRIFKSEGGGRLIIFKFLIFFRPICVFKKRFSLSAPNDRSACTFFEKFIKNQGRNLSGNRKIFQNKNVLSLFRFSSLGIFFFGAL